MSAENYPDTMSAPDAEASTARPSFGALWWVALPITGLVADFAMTRLGVPPWAVLAAAACFLIVAGVVGTMRELRRREARLDAEIARRSG